MNRAESQLVAYRTGQAVAFMAGPSALLNAAQVQQLYSFTDEETVCYLNGAQDHLAGYARWWARGEGRGDERPNPVR